MNSAVNISRSREIIKNDWSLDGYYDDAEKAVSIFWESNGWPFSRLFKELDLSNCIELACGHGRHTAQVLDKGGKFTLVDINQGNIEFCAQRFSGNEKINLYCNDGSSLKNLRDNSYSGAFCYDAMVHFELEDVNSYLQELFRVLSYGGLSLLHFSNYDSNPGGLYHDNPHWRNFNSIPIFTHLAIRAGFEIVEILPVNWGDNVGLDGAALLRKPD